MDLFHTSNDDDISHTHFLPLDLIDISNVAISFSLGGIELVICGLPVFGDECTESF